MVKALILPIIILLIIKCGTELKENIFRKWLIYLFQHFLSNLIPSKNKVIKIGYLLLSEWGFILYFGCTERIPAKRTVLIFAHPWFYAAKMIAVFTRKYCITVGIQANGADNRIIYLQIGIGLYDSFRCLVAIAWFILISFISATEIIYQGNNQNNKNYSSCGNTYD